MYNQGRTQPREIVARYHGRCAETQRLIRVGEVCLFYPIGRRLFHRHSTEMRRWREWVAEKTQMRQAG